MGSSPSLDRDAPGRIVTLLVLCSWLLVGSGCRTQPNATAQPANQPTAASTTAVAPDEYWQNALEKVYKSPEEVLAQHQAELRKGTHYPKVLRGEPGRREVAITFDDGPHPQYTPQLLAILAKYQAKATFFVIGKMVEPNPQLVKDELAAGHSVGNHTFHHVNLTKIPPRLVATEIQACGDLLKSVGVPEPHLFRPPGGDYNGAVAQTIQDLGYTLVLWTDDPGDYASPGATVIEDRTLRMLSNGGIILLHDGVQETVQILPQLLEYLKSRGLKTVTIDEMIRHAPVATPRAAGAK
jgi:peptidoglycan/xylan/chitin deacetylase (PgdA/CDA1 family)